MTFTVWDWSVVVAYFAVTTWLGARWAGKQRTMQDFFLGGNKLPWYAVAGSMIATEISAVTFVSVPAVVFGVGGNFTYLQLALIAGLLARVFVALVLVPAYYKERVFSPYDYMGNQLGGGARGVMTALFSFGGVLAQASRVYLTAVILELVLAGPLGRLEDLTGVPPLVASVLLIGGIAIGWTLLGGIATVIWTDVLLFGVFVLGGLIALVTIVLRLDGGAGELIALGQAGNKFQLFDLGLDLDPTKEFTIWTAAFGTLFANIGAYGTDQLMAQRIFCCKNQREAKKAVLASYAGIAVTALMLLVGVGLWAYYKGEPALRWETRQAVVTEADGSFYYEDHRDFDRTQLSWPDASRQPDLENPFVSKPLAYHRIISGQLREQDSRNHLRFRMPDGQAVGQLEPVNAPTDQWARPLPEPAAKQFAEKSDRIFPIFILSDAIPVGLTGLIIAGIFAAAISSFDSILAALAQTSISAVYLPWRERRQARRHEGTEARRVPGAEPLGVEEATAVTRAALSDRAPQDPSEEAAEARHTVFVSRILVVFWGVLLCGVAFLVGVYQETFNVPILFIALGFAGIVQGGLLAAFFLAWLPLGINGRGLVWAGPLSVLCVLALRFFHTPWFINSMWACSGILLVTWLVTAATGEVAARRRRLWHTLTLAAGCTLLMFLAYRGYFMTPAGQKAALAFPWWPLVGGIIAFTWGYLLADPKNPGTRGFAVLPAEARPAGDAHTGT